MDKKNTIYKLLQLIKQYKSEIIKIVVCFILSAGINLVLPILGRDIIDKGFSESNIKLLINLAIISLGLYILDSCINFFKELKRVDIASNLKYRLSEDAFKHLIKLKVKYLKENNNVELLQRLEMDIESMTSILDENFFFVITQIFGIIGGITGLFIINVKLALIILVLIPIKVVVVFFFSKKNLTSSYNMIMCNQNYSKWFGDTLGGFIEIRLFGKEKYKIKEFSELKIKEIEAMKKKSILSSLNTISDNIIIEGLITIMYIVGGLLMCKGEITIGGIFSFITFSSYVIGPISSILSIGYMLSGILPSTERYYKFMEYEEESEDGEKNIPEDINIEYKNVYFSYNDEVNVLNNINLNIKANTNTAIYGKNGAGKTTILDLLLRMYDDYEGDILINSKNIKDYDISAYRSRISVVSQDIYLFNDTIRNNICLYDNVKECDLMEIIEKCGLSDLVKEKTLDYVVGYNGSFLSGGQRQKIALARALVHKKSILIFDEATSNVDRKSESILNDVLIDELKDQTIIMITHKIDLLNFMDEIVYLDGGEILDKGSYKELLERNISFRENIKLYDN